MKTRIKLIMFLILIPIILLLIVVAIIDYKFNQLKPKMLYSDCLKVWAHRGYSKESPENSLESYKKAFELGAKGVEMDIFFDLDLQDFIVSHDYPYKLENGKFLRLEDVFTNIGGLGYFWLDFKNLNSMSANNASIAVTKMYNLLQQNNLLKKVIIESTDPVNLSRFSKAGLYTSYWIYPDSNRSLFHFWVTIYKYKLNYLLGEFSALSMDKDYYNTKIEKIFSHIPIHLFTVNDNKLLMTLTRKQNVKIILSDENFYSINSCK